MAARKGRMEEMTNHAAGWVRMDFIVPSRGLIGFRTDFLTLTRGTGIAQRGVRRIPAMGGGDPGPAHRLAGIRPVRHDHAVRDDPARRPRPVLRRAGPGHLRGQVVGINPRAEDLDINVTREKKLTNMRSSTADVLETLAKPLELDLEQAMEFCANDECVEVTPEIVRVRKVELDATTRARSRARAKARG